jgi:hypothetical protein
MADPFKPNKQGKQPQSKFPRLDAQAQMQKDLAKEKKIEERRKAKLAAKNVAKNTPKTPANRNRKTTTNRNQTQKKAQPRGKEEVMQPAERPPDYFDSYRSETPADVLRNHARGRNKGY